MPLNLLPLVPMAVSAVGSLLQGSQDPDRWKREELKKLIEEIKTQFPQLEAAMRTREAVERGGMLRRISDVGAAGGLPRNVISQNITSTSLGSQRNLGEQLGQLDMRKMQLLQNLAGIIGQVPQEQGGFPWSDLMGLSVYDFLGQGGFGQLGGGGSNQLPAMQQFQTPSRVNTGRRSIEQQYLPLPR